MRRGVSAWVAHASRVLMPVRLGPSTSSRSRTFVAGSHSSLRIELKQKKVSARRRNQHAERVRYPIRFAAR